MCSKEHRSFKQDTIRLLVFPVFTALAFGHSPGLKRPEMSRGSKRNETNSEGLVKDPEMGEMVQKYAIGACRVNGIYASSLQLPPQEAKVTEHSQNRRTDS